MLIEKKILCKGLAGCWAVAGRGNGGQGWGCNVVMAHISWDKFSFDIK